MAVLQLTYEAGDGVTHELVVDVPEDGTEMHVVMVTIEGESITAVDVDGANVLDGSAPQHPVEPA